MIGLLILLSFKSLVVLVPLSVAILAFRRLSISKSANAWLYAATGLFGTLTTLGLLPWILLAGSSHPVFFVFAAMTPAVWYGVVTLCNSTSSTVYGTEIEDALGRLASRARRENRSEPLILEEPHWPDAPVPVFRHSGHGHETEIPSKPTSAIARASEATRTIVDIARMMRGNPSSERRRIKLLSPPRRSAPRELTLQ